MTPSASVLIGTLRQPLGSRPSARQESSTVARSQPSRRKHIASPAPGLPVSRLGERQQDPCAVARDAVGGPGPTVPDGGEPGERPVEQLPRGAPAHVRDEADATGIPFASWVVQKALLVGHGPSPFAWW